VLRCGFLSSHLVPRLESALHEGTILCSTQTMSFGSEMVRDGTKGGKKALRMARGFETPHSALSLPGWLVRVFCSIVQAFVLAMLDSWQDFLLCGGIARQFVCDDHPWDILESFEQFPKELLRGFRGSRRLWTRISSTLPCWSTARHRYCCFPLIVRKTSSKCHLSPG
jgi:hypothetical protein